MELLFHAIATRETDEARTGVQPHQWSPSSSRKHGHIVNNCETTSQRSSNTGGGTQVPADGGEKKQVIPATAETETSILDGSGSATEGESPENTSEATNDKALLSRYHKERPLAGVEVPRMDRDSVKVLPPALRQLADHNPKGDTEENVLPPRRKRRAVARDDYVDHGAVVRKRNVVRKREEAKDKLPVDRAPYSVQHYRDVKRENDNNLAVESNHTVEVKLEDSTNIDNKSQARSDESTKKHDAGNDAPAKISIESIPTELRRLMDFNQKGGSELIQLGSRRPSKRPKIFIPPEASHPNNIPKDQLPKMKLGIKLQSKSESSSMSLNETSYRKAQVEEPQTIGANTQRKRNGKAARTQPLQHRFAKPKGLSHVQANTSTQDPSCAGPAVPTQARQSMSKSKGPSKNTGIKSQVGSIRLTNDKSLASRKSLRSTPLNKITLPTLSKGADVAALPLALRRLMDFNQTGVSEVVRADGVRQVRKPNILSPEIQVTRANKNRKLMNRVETSEPKTTKSSSVTKQVVTEESHMKKSPTKKFPGGLRTKKQSVNRVDKFPEIEPLEVEESVDPVKEAERERFEACKPFVEDTPAEKGKPSHKVWVLMDGIEHRRLKQELGSQYQYKQMVPSPEFLRRKGYRFTIHIQNEGEFICTLGDSHYVVSGNTRGFSWSHVDPSTIERIEHSDKKFGSRQADGKPNTFSPHFHRSEDLITKLKSNLKNCGFWYQSNEEVKKHNAATAIDESYKRARLAEGWHEDEIKPLYLPTSEQLRNPFWFTSMMQGPGKRRGSLHIKFPDDWINIETHNFGHVPWPESARLWKLEASCLSGFEESEIAKVKLQRPESKGYSLDSKPVQSRLLIHVPTSPKELTSFLSKLPKINVVTPLLYGPQVKTGPAQIDALNKLMPEYAMPLSSIDGMRDAFHTPAEGTTTPTGFGGSFGISGLHDEYNHTVSFFVYPFWTHRQ